VLFGSNDELVEDEVALVESDDVSVVLVEDMDKGLDGTLIDDVDSELKGEEVMMVEDSVDVVATDTILLLESTDVELETELEEVAVALTDEGNDEPLTEEEEEEEEEDELVDSMLEVEESPA
jgi:hypothetical protein